MDEGAGRLKRFDPAPSQLLVLSSSRTVRSGAWNHVAADRAAGGTGACHAAAGPLGLVVAPEGRIPVVFIASRPLPSRQGFRIRSVRYTITHKFSP